MLLGVKKNLEDHIIVCLSRGGNQTVKQIGQWLVKKHAIHVTEQGIYRVLRKLHDDGIVVKEKNLFSLRIPWLLDLSALVDRMQETYLQESYLREILPEEGERYSWYFTDLTKMNSFWSQLLLAMAKKSDSSIALNYSPHLWYELTQQEQEAQFQRVFFDTIRAAFTIIGNKTFLDKYSATILSDEYKKNQYYFADPGSVLIDKNASLYIDVVDDYVLCTKMDQDISDHIDRLYQETTPHTDLHSTNLLDIFANKARIKMVLRRDPKKAAIYRKRFEKIFGPLK